MLVFIFTLLVLAQHCYGENAIASNATLSSNVTLPPGYTNHGKNNLLCRPAMWTDMVEFYVGNYIAHAATLTTQPGQSAATGILAILMALVFPTAGISAALRPITSLAAWKGATELQKAARAGALCMVVKGKPKRSFFAAIIPIVVAAMCCLCSFSTIMGCIVDMEDIELETDTSVTDDEDEDIVLTGDSPSMEEQHHSLSETLDHARAVSEIAEACSESLSHLRGDECIDKLLRLLHHEATSIGKKARHIHASLLDEVFGDASCDRLWSNMCCALNSCQEPLHELRSVFVELGASNPNSLTTKRNIVVVQNVESGRFSSLKAVQVEMHKHNIELGDMQRRIDILLRNPDHVSQLFRDASRLRDIPVPFGHEEPPRHILPRDGVTAVANPTSIPSQSIVVLENDERIRSAAGVDLVREDSRRKRSGMSYNLLGFECISLHGRCELPQGWCLLRVAGNAEFENDPMPSISPWRRPFQTFQPRKDVETILSRNYNVIRILISVGQLLFAATTLYRSRGDQIERYGYAAFSLTVIPYAFMSFVNLDGNLTCPNYDVMYLVDSKELAYLRNVLALAEREAIFPIDGTVGRITTEKEDAILENVTKELNLAWLKRRVRDINFLITALLLGAIPLAIIGGITSFRPGSSSHAQRVWILTWLIFGIVWGSCQAVLSPLPQYINVARRPYKRWALGALLVVCCAPAIGGFVVVGQMISSYGFCEHLPEVAN